MKEMVMMVVVLTFLSAVSGGLLAAIKDNTKERIEYQQLVFVKGPAIRSILQGSANDPITDRFKIVDGDVERSFFVGVFDGKAQAVAFESAGKGYGGEVGLMVGVNLTNDNLMGVGITTHAETPGLGAKAKTDPFFVSQFKGLAATETFGVTTEGGQIDALSGATITSRAVCGGVNEAGKIYQRLKPKIAEQLKQFQ
jgi:electron transport complex protein RnfG